MIHFYNGQAPLILISTSFIIQGPKNCNSQWVVFNQPQVFSPRMDQLHFWKSYLDNSPNLFIIWSRPTATYTAIAKLKVEYMCKLHIRIKNKMYATKELPHMSPWQKILKSTIEKFQQVCRCCIFMYLVHGITIIKLKKTA